MTSLNSPDINIITDALTTPKPSPAMITAIGHHGLRFDEFRLSAYIPEYRYGQARSDDTELAHIHITPRQNDAVNIEVVWPSGNWLKITHVHPDDVDRAVAGAVYGGPEPVHPDAWLDEWTVSSMTNSPRFFTVIEKKTA